jgi:hypothetical protein
VNHFQGKRFTANKKFNFLGQQSIKRESMSNSKEHETRQRYLQVDSHTVKPSYENLEDELINLYPKVDLLNSQLAELKLTISLLCDASEIKGERDYKRALDEFNEKIKLTNLTRLSVIALEAAQTVATLRNDSEKAVLLEHAAVIVKIVNEHAERTE